MHIEPGMLSSAKIAIAQVAAGGLMLAHAPALLKRPTLVLRTLLATVFFSLFMQAFHMKVGPSELHFVGAMPIYLALGFLPTLFGFDSVCWRRACCSSRRILCTCRSTRYRWRCR